MDLILNPNPGPQSHPKPDPQPHPNSGLRHPQRSRSGSRGSSPALRTSVPSSRFIIILMIIMIIMVIIIVIIIIVIFDYHEEMDQGEYAKWILLQGGGGGGEGTVPESLQV